MAQQMCRLGLSLYSQLSDELPQFRESVCDLKVWHKTNDSYIKCEQWHDVIIMGD